MILVDFRGASLLDTVEIHELEEALIIKLFKYTEFRNTNKNNQWMKGEINLKMEKVIQVLVRPGPQTLRAKISSIR